MTALHWAHKREEENCILGSQARGAHMRRVADWTVDDGTGRHDSLTKKHGACVGQRLRIKSQIGCFLIGNIT